MAEYDIASKVVPPKFDPLAMAKDVYGLQGAQLQTKLLGMNVAQTQAQRAAAAAAIDPATGKFDASRYISALAGGGASPEGIAQGQQTYTQQLAQHISEQNLTQEQIKTSLAKLNQVANVAGGLLQTADKIPLTKANIMSAVDNLYKTGVLTEEDKQYEAPLLAQVNDDPANNANVLRNLYARFHPDSEGMNFLRGQITQTDTGPGVAVTQTAGLPTEAGGGVKVAGVIDKGLSPSEVNTPAYTYVDDKGVSHTVLKGQAAAAAPGTQPKGVTASLPLGTPEMAGHGVKFRTDLANSAHEWGNVNSTLANFGTLVDKLASGPKVGAIKEIGQLAAQFGLAPPTAKEDTAALEEAGKLAYQIAQRQFVQLGGTGTDSKLDSAMHTSPSEFLSRLGNKRIIPLLRGNNDAIKAEQSAYETWAQGHGPQEFSDFVRQWNQHYDPRVFQAPYMRPGDVAEMRKSMGKEERANFDAFSAFAKKQGWLGGG